MWRRFTHYEVQAPVVAPIVHSNKTGLFFPESDNPLELFCLHSLLGSLLDNCVLVSTTVPGPMTIILTNLLIQRRPLWSPVNEYKNWCWTLQHALLYNVLSMCEYHIYLEDVCPPPLDRMQWEPMGHVHRWCDLSCLFLSHHTCSTPDAIHPTNSHTRHPGRHEEQLHLEMSDLRTPCQPGRPRMSHG